MKKKLIKTMALALTLAATVAGVWSISTITASAATGIGRNGGQGGEFNTKEINLSYPLYGSAVYTKNDLPMAAKDLYNANPLEGAKVVTIINHANYFSETFYVNDGGLKGNKDAYKNAYIGAALALYQIPFDTWNKALYNSTSYENSIDNGNSITGKGWYSDLLMKGNTANTEAVLVQYINYLVESGKLYVASPDGTYANTSVKSRAFTPQQQRILNVNYNFGTATLDSYKKAFDITTTQYGVGFNDRYDAFNKALYGALVYLNAKSYDTDLDTGRYWLMEQYFFFTDTRTTGINYTYTVNSQNGFDQARSRNITTEVEAIQVAKDLVAGNTLINYTKDCDFAPIN
ncbi:hypothetical protein ACQPU1_07395 [Clostridium paraputrificum]|uniref:hypothetical protein n=1 Tax=Clostridium paraputrificum TaxID=29363 RepID=UPI003D354E39